MSDPQAPDSNEPLPSLREERRAAETVALNKDQLRQLQAQARQEAPGPSIPPPAGAPTPPPPAQASGPPSARPDNHLLLAVLIGVGVVVLVLVLALVAS